jgi:cholesterol transport system auxiliary component
LLKGEFMLALRVLPGLTVPFLLAACVAMLEGQPAATFPLRGADGLTPGAASSKPAGRDIAVAIERPIASGAVASDRLVVAVDNQVKFVAGARWEDDLPTLLAADIALALQGRPGIDVVDAAQRAGRADFSLVTVIQSMQVRLGADYGGQAVTEIVARLVRLPSREIIATATFRGEAPAANDAPDTLARAISTATQKTLAQLASWVETETRR